MVSSSCGHTQLPKTYPNPTHVLWHVMAIFCRYPHLAAAASAPCSVAIAPPHLQGPTYPPQPYGAPPAAPAAAPPNPYAAAYAQQPGAQPSAGSAPGAPAPYYPPAGKSMLASCLACTAEHQTWFEKP